MRRIRRRRQQSNEGEYQSLMAVWMLRLLLGHDKVFKAFYDKRNGYRDDDVADFLNLPCLDDDDIPSVRSVKAEMKKKLYNFSRRKVQSQVVFHNVDLLSRRIALSDLQKKILIYGLLVEDSSEWLDMFRLIPIKTVQQFIHFLATMLDESVQDVKQALSKQSLLRQSGMVGLSKSLYEEGRLLLMDGLDEAVFSDNENEDELMAHFLVKSNPSHLTVADYPHAEQDIKVLKRMIASGIAAGEKGINVLLYGTPGSGKTELARLIARDLGLNLFEVKTADEDGDPIKPNQRLGSYRLSQQILLRDEQSIIMFDEVEDIFPARSFSFFGMEMKSGENKGWMNKLLEENATPAIWICNRVSQMDSAFLRRFDYVMALDTPPKAVRLNIVQSYLKAYASEGLMHRLAAHTQLAPAQIAKLSQVAARMDDEVDMDEVLEKMVENSLEAMSLKPLPKSVKHATHYDAGYLNISLDVESLLQGLRRNPGAQLCFYGAPGTGKTALAAYIADQLGMPLLSKRASDILGMYVGETEKNIAAMFAEAKKEKSVLLLDEADSLLRDRRGASRSWEVSQVNEMLVQMENFDGVFICSTNLMDDLDQASLRRFSMKVQFDYLNPEQALRMLEQECVGEVGASLKHELAGMRHLAPGDFAAVKKRLKLLAVEPTAEVLLKALREEIAVKQVDGVQAIGFGV